MRATAAVLVVVAATIAAATKTIDDITKAAPTYDWHAARQRVRDAMMHEVNTSDVGFQKRGSGKEACALLAKLVT